MGPVIYLLCAAAAATCAYLLLQAYRRDGFRLLLWSGLCFVALAISNVVLFIDLVVVETDLSLVRSSIGLVGVATLLYGLIWDAQ